MVCALESNYLILRREDSFIFSFSWIRCKNDDSYWYFWNFSEPVTNLHMGSNFGELCLHHHNIRFYLGVLGH